ncbi:MAG: hypothetical protein ACMVY4_07835 [Minwuia sp.]|uniref:hypothetical protein n=1 Tax=Minwuia sp. TaxID=2493630 RepID=UPI003A856738
MGKRRQGRPRLIIGRQELRQKRDCLCCGEAFTSYGRFNRLCANCKNDESDYSILGFDGRR